MLRFRQNQILADHFGVVSNTSKCTHKRGRNALWL